MAARSIAALTTATRALRRTGDAVLVLGLAGFLILFALQFQHSPKFDQAWPVLRLRRLGNPVLGQIGSWLDLPWPSARVSLLPIGLAFAVWVVKLGLDTAFGWVERQLGKTARPATSLPAVAERSISDLSGSSLLAAAAVSEKARDKLLRRYREVEQALKAMKRKQCAFLSIDVVDAEGIKTGESDAAIGETFGAYQQTLHSIFEKYAVWKEVWTPDGVMSCFLQVDLAVGAAQRVLESLKDFNAVLNKLRTPLQLCCGVNSGEVVIFEDSKLEKVVDHLIDVAGHMQKKGRPNTLWLAAEVYEQLSDKYGFEPADAVVDSHQVYQWAVRRNESSVAAGGPTG